MNLVNCKKCNEEIEKGIFKCPNCRVLNPDINDLKAGIYFIALVSIVFMLYTTHSTKKPNTSNGPENVCSLFEDYQFEPTIIYKKPDHSDFHLCLSELKIESLERNTSFDYGVRGQIDRAEYFKITIWNPDDKILKQGKNLFIEMLERLDIEYPNHINVKTPNEFVKNNHTFSITEHNNIYTLSVTRPNVSKELRNQYLNY